jgi:hypothetical protein
MKGRDTGVVLVHFVLHDLPAGQRPHVIQHLARKLATGGRLFIRESLRPFLQREIVRLIQRNGLSEIDWSLTQIPLMGPTYDGVFGAVT